MCRLYRKLIERLYFKQEGNLALYDQLTGLYNYNWLKYIGIKKFKNFEGYVTVIDLNGMKQVNDTHGHIYANGVIMSVASQLSSVNLTEPQAAVIRFGGDEFIIISKADYSSELASEPHEIVSFGVYQKSSGEALERAISKADELMYQNKQKFYETHDRRK